MPGPAGEGWEEEKDVKDEKLQTARGAVPAIALQGGQRGVWPQQARTATGRRWRVPSLRRHLVLPKELEALTIHIKEGLE